MSGTATRKGMSSDAKAPNEEQRAFWNEAGAERWVEGHEELDERLHPFGVAAIDAARVQPGETVLDIGCGCGDTSLEMAKRAGADGSVLGLDLSRVMLERARERAQDLENVRFEEGDAQVYPFEARSVDVIFSRFGVMFFEDPTAAFTNLRRALRPEGRLAFVCWQGLEKNPWMAIPLSVTARHVDPGPSPEPGAPGPMSFADADRVRGILEGAGFEGIDVTAFTPAMQIAADVDAAVTFLMRYGPSGRLLRDASSEVVDAVTADMREALLPFFGDEGLGLGSSAWIVTATSD